MVATNLFNFGEIKSVNYVPLKAIADIGTGSSNTNEALEEGLYPFYVRSQEPLRKNEYEYDETAIITAGDGAGVGRVYHFVEGKYALHQRAYRIHVNTDKIIPKFLFYYMKAKFLAYIEKNMFQGAVPSIRRPMLNEFQVPIVPLEIQEQVIEIMDNFESLITLINKELEFRILQGKYYKNKLLSENTDLRIEKIEDVCVLEKGKTPIQKAVAGEYPLVVTTEERKSSNEFQFEKPTVCVPLVSSRGHGVACLNKVYYQEGKFALGNILCGITPKDESVISAKYLYYYLNQKKDTLIVPLMKGGANVSLTVNSLKTVKIEIPSIKDQERIISMLQIFDQLCVAIEEEFSLRTKQYEEYRDKIFNFESE